MSQKTIDAFFTSRKRPATDHIVSSKSKLAHFDHTSVKTRSRSNSPLPKNCDYIESDVKQVQGVPNGIKFGEPKVHKEAVEQIITPSPSQKLPDQGITAFTKKINASNVLKNNEASKFESLQAARKELNLGDIRKKLAGSSRIAEIKAAADRISKGIQEVKAACDKRNLKEFKSIDLEVPSSPNKKALINKDLSSLKTETEPTVQQRPLISPRKVFVSPVKSPTKVPAYVRHASQASSSNLPLPAHYRKLAELFRGMETVVAMLYNRNERITLNKLKLSVQEMLKLSFTEKHLAQIKHLVPDFYTFEVQKVKNFATSSQKESYELVISPNIPIGINVMNPSVVLERRRFFFEILLQLAKKHHAQYLLTLDPPIVLPEDKVTRWHPDFLIKEVPDVECAKLPEIPNTEKISSAQDVLARARQLFNCNTKMERALEKLAQAKARGLTDQEKEAIDNTETKPQTVNNGTQTIQPSTSGVTLINPALRNLPAALLEKVKAKQAAKALEAMTRSSQHDEKYIIYARLPDLARTLRNIFVTERKNVLALNVVLSKLDSSFRASVSANDLHRDIRTLAEVVPDWIKLEVVRNTNYLKLDKNADLKKITTKLEALAQKYKGD